MEGKRLADSPDDWRHRLPKGWGWIAYVCLIAIGVGAFFLIRSLGIGQTVLDGSIGSQIPSAAPPAQHPVELLFHVLATLSAVIALGFFLSKACRYINQPPVIGEIMAGLLLGPSVLGAISPDAMHFFIPDKVLDPHGQVLSAMKIIAQLGIILYMFLVGLELNAAQLRGKATSAIAISHSSIVVQFILGSSLALWLHSSYSPAGVSFTSFALFMGVAMSITAFPVLARILTDRGLSKTNLGVLALACAATDDVTAWCLLALAIGVAQAEIRNGLMVGATTILYLTTILLFVRPWIVRISNRFNDERESLPPYIIYGTFVLILLSALTTDAIGIHAVFGAFLFGVIVPHDGRIAKEFITKLRDPVMVMLLPAFFALTGMRTEIGLLDSWHSWGICILICLIATIGKFGAACLVSRALGNSWRDSAALGTLMNTRGLMEIIVLNIGLDLGVITPTLFAMMVIMALATTMATSPVLKWFTGGEHQVAEVANPPRLM